MISSEKRLYIKHFLGRIPPKNTPIALELPFFNGVIKFELAYTVEALGIKNVIIVVFVLFANNF